MTRTVSSITTQGRALAGEALRMRSGDPVRALVWLWIRWRTLPDAHERAVRTVASGILTTECDEAQRRVWMIYRTDMSVDRIAASLAAVHERRNRNNTSLGEIAA